MGLLTVLLALSAVVVGALSGVLGRTILEERTTAHRALAVGRTAGTETVTRRAADPIVQNETVRCIIGSCFGGVSVEVTRDVVTDPAMITGASEVKPFARWTIRPESARIAAERLDPLVWGATALRQQLCSSEVGAWGVQVLGDLGKTAASAARNLAVARAPSQIPSGLLAIVVALAVSQMTRLSAIARETGALQSLDRGTTGGQVLSANLVEADVVAPASLLTGSSLAWAVLTLFGDVLVTSVPVGGAITSVLILGCVALTRIGRLRGSGRGETSQLRMDRLQAAITATSPALVMGGTGLVSAQLLRIELTIQWNRKHPILGWSTTAAPASFLLLAALVTMALLSPPTRLAKMLLL